MNIIVFNADKTRLELIGSILHSAGHQALCFSSEQEMQHHLRRDDAAMFILEWQDFSVDAATLLRWIKENFSSTLPVLLIVNCSDEENIIQGLEAGVSDYIIKPIRRTELVARVQVLLRRAYPLHYQQEYLTFGDYVFEVRSSQLSVSGKKIKLTQKEFDLALLLFRYMNAPLSRVFIINSIWSAQRDVPSRTLDTHISRVRNKLQLHPENGFRLAPVYSYGYQLEQLHLI